LTSYSIYLDYYGNVIRDTNKSKYNLEIYIEDSGIFRSTEFFHEKEYSCYGYWYWTDDINPHKRIFIQPAMISLMIIDFDLILVNENNLILHRKFEDSPDPTAGIIYKFQRSN
jgi:hypothetical protein